MEVPLSNDSKDQSPARIKKPRYNGKFKKRQWENKKSQRDEGEPDEKRSCEEPFERIKRRKVAVLLGYSGADYFGMQRNPGVNTIEEDLCKALLKINYITEDAYNQMQNIQFQRAARTDKGVSAAMQVVSLKLPNDAIEAAINEELPPCIRIFSIERVTKGFNSKIQCDARTYTYTLPSYAFEDHSNKIEDKNQYRVSPEKIQKVNEILKLYLGSKNFHNFTSRKEYSDPSALRYMISFEVEKVFVSSGMEFAVLKVKGQSFMLHQIRKMVGLTLAVVRELTDVATVATSFTSKRIDLPMAPSLGLVLDQVHYDRYNERYGTDGIHATLTWDSVLPLVDKFKQDFIYPNIIKTEVSEDTMAQWLDTLPCHSYDVREEDKPKSLDVKESSVNGEEKVVDKEEMDDEENSS